jgi:TPR repeat protein
MKSGEVSTCAFCRTVAPRSDEEVLAQTRRRVELKDPVALVSLAMNYGLGKRGLSVDEAKCIELLREAADLGFPAAKYQLGNFYDNGEMGLEQNAKEALKYLKEAAEGGDILARNNVACIEHENGNDAAGMRHLRSAASGGYRKSMNTLIVCFEDGFLKHGDLAKTLRAFYRARAEIKSEHRDEYFKYLKMTGEYKEDMEA